MAHFDMSIWGFEKLASTKWGVIPLRWRAVPCNYQPSKPAPPVAYPTPGQSPPAGAKDPAAYPNEDLSPNKTWSQQQQGGIMYQPFSTFAQAKAAMGGAGDLHAQYMSWQHHISVRMNYFRSISKAMLTTAFKKIISSMPQELYLDLHPIQT